MAKQKVGVLGASSMVGECLLAALNKEDCQVIAFSRSQAKKNVEVEWRQLPTTEQLKDITNWISVAPIWVLPEYFKLILASGAKRIVAVSSTSRFTKVDSSDPAEYAIVEKLIQGEERLKQWAQSCGIEWVILRPTLIYGKGRDKNISEIARFIRRFGFFPLFGKAEGLRQPIHARDVSDACVKAIKTSGKLQKEYDISGGDTLTYREMVKRVFIAMDCTPRLLTVPLWVFRIAVSMLRCLPRYKQWSSAMAERMNQDLVFDQAEAFRDLNFKPGSFVLNPEDMPR